MQPSRHPHPPSLEDTFSVPRTPSPSEVLRIFQPPLPKTRANGTRPWNQILSFISISTVSSAEVDEVAEVAVT